MGKTGLICLTTFMLHSPSVTGNGLDFVIGTPKNISNARFAQRPSSIFILSTKASNNFHQNCDHVVNEMQPALPSQTQRLSEGVLRRAAAQNFCLRQV